MITLAVFIFFAVLAVAAAVLVIVQKNAMHSVLYLAFTVLATAGVFFTLQAEYLGAIQILVYGGGIVVLYIFVIIIVNLKEIVPERRRLLPKLFLIAVPAAARRRDRLSAFRERISGRRPGRAGDWGSRPWPRRSSAPISSPSSWPRSCSWPCSSGPSSSPGGSSSMIPIEAVIGLGLLLFVIGLVGVARPQEPGRHADVARAPAQRGQRHPGRAGAITSTRRGAPSSPCSSSSWPCPRRPSASPWSWPISGRRRRYDIDALDELKG